jgi:hypothetical protein
MVSTMAELFRGLNADLLGLLQAAHG